MITNAVLSPLPVAAGNCKTAGWSGVRKNCFTAALGIVSAQPTTDKRPKTTKKETVRLNNFIKLVQRKRADLRPSRFEIVLVHGFDVSIEKQAIELAIMRVPQPSPLILGGVVAELRMRSPLT